MARALYGDVAYAPFGETYSVKSTPYLSFTGQQQDTLAGLYDFLFREYSPVQGRWLTPDPAGLDAVDFSDPQSWNRYAYLENIPTEFVDPLGLDGLSPEQLQCVQNQLNYANQAESEFMAGQGSRILSAMGSGALKAGFTGAVIGSEKGAEIGFIGGPTGSAGGAAVGAFLGAVGGAAGAVINTGFKEVWAGYRYNNNNPFLPSSWTQSTYSSNLQSAIGKNCGLKVKVNAQGGGSGGQAVGDLTFTFADLMFSYAIEGSYGQWVMRPGFTVVIVRRK